MGYIRVYCGKELREQFELGEDRVTIGRVRDNSLVLADEGISRHHAAIEFQDGNYFIVDLDSRNGVFLNNQRIEKEKLKFWDEIQIHNFVIKFMSKPGLVAKKQLGADAPLDTHSDKTAFVSLANEKQLDELRQMKKKCYLRYKDHKGTTRKVLIKKQRVVIGKAKDADIKISAFLGPSIAATIVRHGGSYELVPSKRGKVLYEGQPIVEPTPLVDDVDFQVRGVDFKFYNRLIKT